MQKGAVDPIFPVSVLFTDKASFTRIYMAGLTTTRMVPEVTLRNIILPSMYGRESLVTICSGTLLATISTGRAEITNLSRDSVTDFLGAVPAHVWRGMWYQHDKAPSYTTNTVRDYLNRIYGARWIGNVDRSLGQPSHLI